MPQDPLPQVTTLNDRISGDRAEQLATDLGHQKSRLVIQEVVKEYVGSTEFERIVEDTIKRSLEMDSTQAKLQPWFTRSFDKAVSKRGWQNKTFWIPTIIASIAAIAAVVAIFVKTK